MRSSAAEQSDALDAQRSGGLPGLHGRSGPERLASITQPEGVAMFARVSTYTGDPDELNRGFESARDDLQQIEGFTQGYFCVDRGSGKGLTITLWENEQALDASAEQAKQLRSRATEPSGATIESVQHYEVTQTVP